MLRRSADVGLNLGAAAHFEFVSENADLRLVFLLHLQLILFELIDLVSDQLHLLNLLSNLVLNLLT